MKFSDKADDKLMAEIYNKTKDPREWLRQAEYLNAAGSSVVESSSEFFKKASLEPNIYKKFEMVGSPNNWMIFAGVMLYGFALENLLKGLWVASDPSTVSPSSGRVTTRWGKERKSHALVWIANEQNICMNTDETELLDFLTKVTTWGGRYPAPNNAFGGDVGMEWNEKRANTYSRLYERFRRGILPNEVS